MQKCKNVDIHSNSVIHYHKLSRRNTYKRLCVSYIFITNIMSAACPEIKRWPPANKHNWHFSCIEPESAGSKLSFRGQMLTLMHVCFGGCHYVGGEMYWTWHGRGWIGAQVGRVTSPVVVMAAWSLLPSGSKCILRLICVGKLCLCFWVIRKECNCYVSV